MLPKKGDKKDPYNYRGIALINSLTKLLSMKIANRITKWTETNLLIPEEQAGFWAKRGCRDHLLTLNAIVNIHLSRSDDICMRYSQTSKERFIPSVTLNYGISCTI